MQGAEKGREREGEREKEKEKDASAASVEKRGTMQSVESADSGSLSVPRISGYLPLPFP